MCGIFGWSLKQAPDEQTQVQLCYLTVGLTLEMDQRGGDGWGYIADGEITRGLGEMAGDADVRVMCRAQTLIAHTRFATHGAKGITNTHPFEVEHIVGAHNGIIFNHEAINKRYGRTHTVDSLNLFEHLAKGMHLGELHGYGALEWIERDAPHVVHLTRFNTDDLHIHSLGQLGMVWASTKEAIEDACEMAGIHDGKLTTVPCKLYTVTEGRLRATKRKLGFSTGTTREEYLAEKWFAPQGYVYDDDMEYYQTGTKNYGDCKMYTVTDRRRISLIEGHKLPGDKCECGDPECENGDIYPYLHDTPIQREVEASTKLGDIVAEAMKRNKAKNGTNVKGAGIDNATGAICLPDGRKLSADGGRY